jgi:hypothetical protein
MKKLQLLVGVAGDVFCHMFILVCSCSLTSQGAVLAAAAVAVMVFWLV